MSTLRVWVVVALLGLALGLPRVGAADQGPPLALADVAHVLDGRVLTITGRVENHGQSPVAGLIVDATGYAPVGDLVFQASDGIPWGLAAGKTERFTARLPITDRPIRAYTLQIAFSRPPRSPLVNLRRIVEPSTYRPLLASTVQVKGSIRGDTLSIRADAGQWPVAQVTVEATISVPVFQSSNPMILSPRNIDTVIIQVPGNGTADAPLGTRGVELLFLRVIDAQPFTTWGD